MARKLTLFGESSKEKSIVYKTITKIINDGVISSSALLKIVKINHNYNVFLISDSHFNLWLGFIRWRMHPFNLTRHQSRIFEAFPGRTAVKKTEHRFWLHAG